MDLLTLPASDLAARLARREIGAAELLEAALARVAALNPALNAVVTRDAEGARRAAAGSDRRLAAGEGRALEGLPITVKDAFDVAGLRSTAGTGRHAERVPEHDAAAVARLRAAGAGLIGKSNVPAVSGDFQAFNALFGTTRNPWDPDRSPGGSSGGAAAAVATGMSAFELGSDFAGSIRWPAHACGLFGHKPSWGLVSTRGHVPPPPGTRVESDFSVAGPLARSAADLGLVLDTIAGPAALDGVRPHLEAARRTTPAGLRVALWADDPLAPVDAPVRAGVERAAALLARAGAAVSERARPDFSFADAFEAFALFNHAIVSAGLKPEARERLAAEAGRFAPGDRSHQALQARGAKLDAATWAALQARRRAIRAAWERFFEEIDVMLCPPAPVPAIPHDHVPDFHARALTVNGESRPYFDFLVWSLLATLPGLPAAVAPVGLTAEGLPVGVQIIAAAGADRTALAVASMLESLGCRYQPPPLIAGG